MAKSAYLEVGMPSMRYVSNRRSDVKVGEDHPGNNDLRVRFVGTIRVQYIWRRLR
jgi:hypothetical protein